MYNLGQHSPPLPLHSLARTLSALRASFSTFCLAVQILQQLLGQKASWDVKVSMGVSMVLASRVGWEGQVSSADISKQWDGEIQAEQIEQRVLSLIIDSEVPYISIYDRVKLYLHQLLFPSPKYSRALRQAIRLILLAFALRLHLHKDLLVRAVTIAALPAKYQGLSEEQDQIVRRMVKLLRRRELQKNLKFYNLKP